MSRQEEDFKSRAKYFVDKAARETGPFRDVLVGVAEAFAALAAHQAVLDNWPRLYPGPAGQVQREEPREELRGVPRQIAPEVPRQETRQVPNQVPSQVPNQVPSQVARDVAREVPRSTAAPPASTKR